MRQFKPKLVAIRDASKVGELKERLKGAHMPEIVVGDAGAVECAQHPDAEAVITGEAFGAVILSSSLRRMSFMSLPEAVVGDAGAVECAQHLDADR